MPVRKVVPLGKIYKDDSCWGVFKVTPVPGKKPRKVPVDVDTLTAQDVKQAFVLPMHEALGACKRAGDGSLVLGYLPKAGSNFIGLDLDACVRADGTREPWAEELLAGYEGPVAETVSGTGLRIMLPREAGDETRHNSGEANDVGFYADGGRGFTVPPVLAEALAEGGLIRDEGLVERVLERLERGKTLPGAGTQAASTEPDWFGRLGPQDQEALVREALGKLPEDFHEDRDRWLGITFGLRELSFRVGWDVEAVWREWSAQSNKHDAGSEEVWDRSDARSGGVTLGTVLGTAKGYGLALGPWAEKGRARGSDEFEATDAKVREMEDIFGAEAVAEAREEAEVKAQGPNPLLGVAGRWSGLSLVQPPPPNYAVPGYVPRGLLTSLYGVDGIGKNMLMQRACMMGVARGEFLGQPVGPDFRAAFFGVEDTEGAILDRAWRIGRDAGFGAGDWTALDDRFVMPELIDVDAKLVSWDRHGELVLGKLIRQMSGFVDAWKPDLVVLDPISDLFEDEENNRQRVVGFMRTLIRFARKKDVGLVLLGHPARSDGSEYSGSGAWSSKVRSRMFMERDEDDESLIWLRHRKASYGRPVDDRECRFNGSGVLVDQAMAGAAVGGGGGGRAVSLQDLGDALRDMARMGDTTSASVRAQNNFGRLAKRHKLVPGASDAALNKAVFDAIKDGFLVGNHRFDGSNGTPRILQSNGTAKVGLWFKP